MADNEIWRVVPDSPDWEASSLGNVRHHGVPKIPFKMNTGYMAVSINRAPVTVHRMVCKAFHGMPPADKPMALHLNGEADLNQADNLYWGDAVDNAEDARKHGTMATGSRHGAYTRPEKFKGHLLATHTRKLNPSQVDFIRKNYQPRHPDFSGKALSEKFNVDPATIRKVHAGTTYTGV